MARRTHRPMPKGANRPESFSLLEMMMVVTVILILASISAPLYMTSVVRAREAVLRDDLFTLRSLIDRFTLDNRRSPARLEELVEGGYLGRLPTDPFTGSNEIRRLTDRCRTRTRPSHRSNRGRGLWTRTAAQTSFHSKARRTTLGSAG